MSYVILAGGVLDFDLYYGAIISYGFPQNMGLVFGATAIVFLGGIVVIPAGALQKLERRVAELEKKNTD